MNIKTLDLNRGKPCKNNFLYYIGYVTVKDLRCSEGKMEILFTSLLIRLMSTWKKQ